jgi:hypothetical protein
MTSSREQADIDAIIDNLDQGLRLTGSSTRVMLRQAHGFELRLYGGAYYRVTIEKCEPSNPEIDY